MRLTRIAFASLILIPTIALALEISPGDFYDDVRPSSPEAAGINLLTREGVVQGYGDHIFGPARPVNRAEFLKMAMLAISEAKPTPKNLNCFPDVKAADWFSPYVCGAAEQNIVKGYPDGRFHPERTVQYDEALKMLTLLFGYSIPDVKGVNWVEPYYRAAHARQVELPVAVDFAKPLSRALTARLVGAFLAESQGKLSEFRDAEQNKYPPLSSSSSSFSSSLASSDSSVSSSSSSTSTSYYTLPSVSHFLVTGSKSDAVADMTVKSSGERAYIALAQVKVYTEVRSMESLELTLEDGTVVATLLRRTTTDIPDYKLTFEAQIQTDKQYLLPADKDVKLVLRAVVRSTENGGFSEDLLQVRSMSVTIRGETSNTTVNVASQGPFPKHQTALGKITSIALTGPETGTLASGSGKVINAFVLTGTGVAGKAIVSPVNLVFSLTKNGSIDLTRWGIRRAGQTQYSECSFNELSMTVSCNSIASVVGSVTSGGLNLELIADVQRPAGATGITVEADLPSPGSPEAFGSLQWTDGSVAEFKWVEGKAPVLTGTKWN